MNTNIPRIRRMPDLLQKERDNWLDEARAAAKRLLKKRAYVTIEDVLKICPRPTYIHRNTTGNVFRDDDFTAFGWAPSKRPLMNGRQVRLWRLR